MTGETSVADHPISNKHATQSRSPVGDWQIHSWGNGNFSCMAAVNAITTLQIGATLAPVPADQIALNEAAEYLINALAPQLKPLRQVLAANASNKK